MMDIVWRATSPALLDRQVALKDGTTTVENASMVIWPVEPCCQLPSQAFIHHLHSQF